MKKSELRTLYLERRRSLSPADRRNASRKIANIFLSSVNLNAVKILHCFISIEKFFEVDTSIIFRRLWAGRPEMRTVAPRLKFETGELESVLLTPETEIIRNRWGIDEPANSELINASQIDMVLVPLLAFDGRGFRVGHGRGFYDKFLSKCRPDCVKAGINFFPAVDEIDDVYEGDVRLDFCITPDGTFAAKTP